MLEGKRQTIWLKLYKHPHIGARFSPTQLPPRPPMHVPPPVAPQTGSIPRPRSAPLPPQTRTLPRPRLPHRRQEPSRQDTPRPTEPTYRHSRPPPPPRLC